MRRWTTLLALGPATAAAQPAPSPLVVQAGGRESRVAVVEDARGRDFVRADQLATALGGSLEGDDGRWVLRLAGVPLALRDDLPVARSGAAELPLLAAPYGAGAVLWVPLQLATDVLPRLAPAVTVDAGTGVLRVAPAVAATPPPDASAPASTAAGADGGPAVRLPTIRGRRNATPPAESRPPRVSTSDPAVSDVRPASPTPSAAPFEASAPDVDVTGRRRRTVVVDAGHGGPDAGMVGRPPGGPAVAEKDVTLGVARALRDALAAGGIGVVMTRTRDTLVALSDRGRIANQRKGDLFVSIHVNAANPAWRDPASARGFETYFLSEARTEDARRVEAMENDVVRFETAARAGQGDPLGFVLRDMAQNEHLRESSRLAAVVQRRLAQVHPGPSRGVKQAGFKVLVTAYMPAILVEIGYGTNAAEASYIASARGQQQIAAAIAGAVREYLAGYDRKIAAPPTTGGGDAAAGRRP